MNPGLASFHCFLSYYRFYFSTFQRSTHRLVNFLLLIQVIPYYWFVTIEVIADRTVTHAEQILFKCGRYHMCFLHEAHHRLLALRTPDGFPPLFLLTVLSSKITNKKHTKNVEDVALRHWKGYLFTVWELKQEVRLSTFSVSCGNMCMRNFNISYSTHVVNDRESVTYGVGHQR